MQVSRQFQLFDIDRYQLLVTVRFVMEDSCGSTTIGNMYWYIFLVFVILTFRALSVVGRVSRYMILDGI